MFQVHIYFMQPNEEHKLLFLVYPGIILCNLMFFEPAFFSAVAAFLPVPFFLSFFLFFFLPSIRSIVPGGLIK